MDETIASVCTDQERKLAISTYTGTPGQWNEISFRDVSEIRTCFNPVGDRFWRISCCVQADTMASRIVFQDYDPGWTCAVVVEGGQEGQAEQLREILSGYVKETFQWYSFITSARVTQLAIASYLAWSAWMLWGRRRFGPSSPVSPKEVEMSTFQWILTIGMGLVLLVIGIYIWALLMRLLELLYPKGTFLIGQEIRRHKTVVWWRRTLLTCLAFPLVLAVGIALFG